MQTYRINSFVASGIIYTLDTTDGCYKDNNNNNRHLYDFFGNSSSIRSVTNKKTNKTYSTGDDIIFNDNTSIVRKIGSLSFRGGVLVFNHIYQEVNIVNKSPEEIQKEQMNKITKVENAIKEKYPRALRFDNGILKNRKESIAVFLEKFFTKWNLEKNTIYADNKEIQTVANRRRSIGDIYTLCKYYYPSITLKEIVDVLQTNVATKRGWRSSYCSQTKCRMYYFSENSGNGLYDPTTKDEYGMLYNEYNLKTKNG